MKERPILRMAYRHFKGGLYVVLGLAYDEKTGDEVVIYSCLSTNKLYTRPLEGFFDVHPKLGVPRFKLEIPKDK